jgi:hypothetical protein
MRRQIRRRIDADADREAGQAPIAARVRHCSGKRAWKIALDCVSIGKNPSDAGGGDLAANFFAKAAWVPVRNAICLTLSDYPFKWSQGVARAHEWAPDSRA